MCPGILRRAECLRDLVKSMAAHGRPLAATAFPSHHTLSGPSSDWIEWFSTIVDESQVPYFDLARQLAQTRRSTFDLYFLPHDGHASPAAYGIAALALARSIHDAGLLARARSKGTVRATPPPAYWVSQAGGPGATATPAT